MKILNLTGKFQYLEKLLYTQLDIATFYLNVRSLSCLKLRNYEDGYSLFHIQAKYEILQRKNVFHEETVFYIKYED